MKEKDAQAIANALHCLASVVAPSLSATEVVDVLVEAEEKKKNPPVAIEGYYSAAEAARYLRISKPTLLARAKEGKIPFVRNPAGRIFFSREAVQCQNTVR